jgi:hypothetical protein
MLSSDINQTVRLLFLGILVLTLLMMMIDYFNGCVRALVGQKVNDT